MQLLGSRVSSQQFKGFAKFDNVVFGQIVVSSYHSDGFAQFLFGTQFFVCVLNQRFESFNQDSIGGWISQ